MNPVSDANYRKLLVDDDIDDKSFGIDSSLYVVS